MTDGRHVVRAELSPTARAGLYRFARAHTVTVTALLEVAGLLLGSQADQVLDQLPPPLQALVIQAREVDIRRRRRRPPDPTPP